MPQRANRRFGTIAVVLSIGVLVAAVSCDGGAETPDGPSIPRRIVAIGDSITLATNACCLPGNQPTASWSVGGGEDDAVTSHLERLAGAAGAHRIRAFNVARPGATVADALRQAEAAVRRRADYVTVLLGANDACRSPMTPVDVFEERFGAAIDALGTGLPRARVLVASVPNVVRLWGLFRDDPTARTIWRTFGTCPSVLAETTTPVERNAVLERIRAYNAVLRRTCADHPRCRFDRGAVFRYAFARDEVSALDRFHPSVDGQAALARLTWSRSWWASLGPAWRAAAGTPGRR